MGRRRYSFDEKRVQKFLAEGRGTGVGRNYKPWLHIQDVPSLGRSHRTFGLLTHRVHHLLSDGEWKVFLTFEQDYTTLDIREQFPMNRLETYQAARHLGIRPPRTADGTPYVMTIDFLITQRVASGAVVQRPLTFKYSQDLSNPRQQQLLKVASLYWQRRGLMLEIIDETLFNDNLIENYNAVRAFYRLPHSGAESLALQARLGRTLVEAVGLKSSLTLRELCQEVAGRYGIDPHAVFDVARHLIARRHLHANLRLPMQLQDHLVCDLTLLGQDS